jgi:hypothetical protein
MEPVKPPEELYDTHRSGHEMRKSRACRSTAYARAAPRSNEAMDDRDPRHGLPPEPEPMRRANGRSPYEMGGDFPIERILKRRNWSAVERGSFPAREVTRGC